MIDFACKEFQMDEVLKCSFGLTRAEMRILKGFLSSDDWLQSDLVADMSGLDRTTAQRAVKKLSEQGVLERRQMNLEGGGYLFTYRIKDRQQIRNLLIGIIRNWAKQAEEEINRW